MKRLVVLSLLLLSTCYPHTAVHLRYSERGAMVFRTLPVNWSYACDFPEELKPPVREGFTYWNKILERDLFVELPGCGVLTLILSEQPRVLVTFVPGPHPDKAEILATTDVGLFGGIPRSAVLRYYGTWADHKLPHPLESAARHEAGHVLGFDHSDLERCLMFPTITMENYVRKPKTACKEEVEMAKQLYGRKD